MTFLRHQRRQRNAHKQRGCTKEARILRLKIVPNIKPTYFQPAIYIFSSGPCNSNPGYNNSFCTEISGITGGLIFMLSLIQYFDIDPEPNASVTVYCENFSAIRRVDTPLRKWGTRHRLVLSTYPANCSDASRNYVSTLILSTSRVNRTMAPPSIPYLTPLT